MIGEVLAEASGRSHRRDAVLPRSGGPGGNAQLTAWTGLVLLALFAAEICTTLDVEGLLSWHVALGALLVPYALVKTASTSWRLVRYYTGHRPYREAGPPPLLLRVLGPLVVIATLGLLGSGVALILVGPSAGRRPFVTIFGQGLDDLTLHQTLFIVFCVVTGLHLLARFVPAIMLATGRVERGADGADGADGAGSAGSAVPGRAARALTVTIALGVAALLAVLLVHRESAWSRDRSHFGPPPGAVAHASRT